MRRLAAALIVVMATVTLADPLFCADGCGQRPIAPGHHADMAGPSDDCATCQVPLSPQSVVPLRPMTTFIVPLANQDVRLVALCDLGPLERPPRSV